MSISPFSKRRLQDIASGKVKVGRSTFKQLDVAEIRARQSDISKKVADALFGKAKGPENGREERRKWKQLADKWFSEFIRLRDSDAQGIAVCITSGKRAHWRTMDCGHYVSRAKEAVRYDEKNCNAQSKIHNQFQGGHFVEHGDAIDRKHGAGTAEALRQKGLTRCSRTTADYRFIAETYKARVAMIKANEPERYKPL